MHVIDTIAVAFVTVRVAASRRSTWSGPLRRRCDSFAGAGRRPAISEIAREALERYLRDA